MNTRTKQIVAVLAVLGMSALGTAASAGSCVPREIHARQAEVGSEFGQVVSASARDPEQFGFSSWGEAVRLFATSEHDSCPIV